MTAIQLSVPAVASAIAASFSALTAVLVLLIQRRNSLESARPELVLTDWKRNSVGSGDSERDVVSFGAIRNVGRGPALHVYMNSFGHLENRPSYMMSTTRIPILAAGESEQLNCEITVWWKNVQGDEQGRKHLLMDVTIYCWDSRNRRHETKYKLMAVLLVGSQGVADAVAPGVMLHSRVTTSRPVWLLKLRRLPGRLVGGPKRLFSRWRR